MGGSLKAKAAGWLAFDFDFAIRRKSDFPAGLKQLLLCLTRAVSFLILKLLQNQSKSKTHVGIPTRHMFDISNVCCA